MPQIGDGTRLGVLPESGPFRPLTVRPAWYVQIAEVTCAALLDPVLCSFFRLSEEGQLPASSVAVSEDDAEDANSLNSECVSTVSTAQVWRFGNKRQEVTHVRGGRWTAEPAGGFDVAVGSAISLCCGCWGCRVLLVEPLFCAMLPAPLCDESMEPLKCLTALHNIVHDPGKKMVQ